MGTQEINGKAFEYALAQVHKEYLEEMEINVNLLIDNNLIIAENCFKMQNIKERKRFEYCAALTTDTLTKLEPGLAFSDDDNELTIAISPDRAGEDGDVRDIIFSRQSPSWAVGISAKNNNDVVKNSRLSRKLDFGESWFGVKCSQRYWNEIGPIFDLINEYKGSLWSDMGSEFKSTRIYTPLLKAFRKELLRIDSEYEGIPQELIRYLIGRFDFYKIIKLDSKKMVVIKAFNLNNELSQTYDNVKAQFKAPLLKPPSRIIEFEMKEDSDNTLIMTLDGGWSISFRIHNASSKVESSLKFDIQLIGNPPVIFTQYLFQDDEID